MRLAAALLALVFVFYFSTLNHPFFFDDSHFILNNFAIQSPTNLLRLWTSATYNSSIPDQWGYRPFTTFLHSLAWLAGNGESWPFHVEKLLLHALSCLLLFLMWKRLWSCPGFYPERAPRLRFSVGGWKRDWTLEPAAAALCLALVFAIHPANSEVLNYISATTTLLAGTCYLAAYCFYLRFRETENWAALAGSYALYALSVLAKEEGITLVAVILLTEVMLPSPNAHASRGPGAPRSGRRKAAVGGYIILAAFLALLLRLMFAEISSHARGSVSRWHYFITQWRAYLHYMLLLIWPSNLNADNLAFGFSTSLWDPRVLIALFGNLLLIGAAWIKRKRYPIFLFSLLWFYIAVSPASSIVPLAEPVNDHRMYLAYAGLLGAVLPWVLKGLERASAASGAIAVLGLLGLATGLEIRNHVWSSQEALWSDTVTKNPSSGRALNNFALVYLGRSDWPGARVLLERCLQVAPTYSICRTNYALLLAATGHDEEAEKDFHEAIAMDELSPVARSFYAGFLSERGRWSEALEAYRELDRNAAGADLEAKIGWSKAARMLGRTEEARGVLEEARRRFGDQPQILASLAEGNGS